MCVKGGVYIVVHVCEGRSVHSGAVCGGRSVHSGACV